jgi:hypothetical protein
VTNDQDMMDMFSAFESSKYIELNAFICPMNATQSVTSNTENAPKASNVHDQSCNQSNTSSQQASLIPVLCDTSYLANPFPMYEHVGVDEEGMYEVEVVDVTIPTNCIVVEKGVSVQGSGREEESSEGEERGEGEEGSENRETSNARENNIVPQNEIGLEEWVARDDVPDFIPSAAYDKANPSMTVGSIYPSIVEFRITLSQYTIKHKREFNIEKSDKDRVRLYCAAKAKGCKWRLHASTLSDQMTAQENIFH